ncbi:unnamed protein product, partial [Didymodactylos carnosus]
MSSFNHITVLEDFSAELFFELFDFFHFIELYSMFAHLNRRIDDYLAELSKIYLTIIQSTDKLTTKLNEQQLLRVRLLKLVIWNGKNRHEIQEFFIQYPLKLFHQLRSLTLSDITFNTELPVTIDQLSFLHYLTSLDVQFDLFRPKSNLTIDEVRHAYETIFRCCVTLKTLNFTIWDDLNPR